MHLRHFAYAISTIRRLLSETPEYGRSYTWICLTAAGLPAYFEVYDIGQNHLQSTTAGLEEAGFDGAQIARFEIRGLKKQQIRAAECPNHRDSRSLHIRPSPEGC